VGTAAGVPGALVATTVGAVVGVGATVGATVGAAVSATVGTTVAVSVGTIGTGEAVWVACAAGVALALQAARMNATFRLIPISLNVKSFLSISYLNFLFNKQGNIS
jgi:hypothetical protein